MTYFCKTTLDDVGPHNRKTCRGPAMPSHRISLGVGHQSTPEMCPDGWLHFKGMCYLALRTSTDWSSGRKLCENRGGDLAKIPTREHNDFLTDMLLSPSWLLLNDRRKEGRFEYSPSEQGQFFMWVGGEPNNGIFPWENEDCVVAYHVFGSTSRSKKWNDEVCGAKTAVACSRDSEVYWLDGLNCTGMEPRLVDCQHGTWGLHECDRNQAVLLSCSTLYQQPGFGNWKALNAKLVYKGYLQIWNRGRWRYVCDRNFDRFAAKTACGQLHRTTHLLFEYLPHKQRSLVQFYAGCIEGLQKGTECTREQEGVYRCDNLTVTCTEKTLVCARNRYGEGCNKVCGHCAKSACSQADGTCSEDGCQPGYRGPKCDEACPAGTWGSKCLKKCDKCIDGNCDVTDGTCSTDQCKAGYKGHSCNESCPGGSWGTNCSKDCGMCVSPPCDAISGRCQGDKCQKGFRDKLCNTVCRPGYWGSSCASQCGPCLGSPCYSHDGRCKSTMCQAGFHGQQCSKACPPGRWGNNCLKRCGKCKNGPCNAVDGLCFLGGCQAGYHGNRCQEALPGATVCDVNCPVCPGCHQGHGDSTLQCVIPDWLYPSLYATAALTVLSTWVLSLSCLYIYCCSRRSGSHSTRRRYSADIRTIIS